MDVVFACGSNGGLGLVTWCIDLLVFDAFGSRHPEARNLQYIP